MKPCKWEETYWEDVAGDGGPSMEMIECKYSGGKDVSDDCGPNCPAYEEDDDHSS